jgi:sterol desaturase/sphingolipid hydroxylase (fatty acid hydroxylase superfamily)
MRPAIWTVISVGSALGLLFLLERVLPLRARTTGIVARLFVNLVMSALAFVVAAILVRPATIGAMGWSAEAPFGLMHVLNLPPAARFIVGFLWMDLTFYWWHVANHRIRFLWRFHNVHHIDPDLDVSTGFRFHFGEVAMSVVFRVASSRVGWDLGAAVRSLRSRVSDEHTVSSQQRAAPYPARTPVEQNPGDATNARHSPFTSSA